MGFIKYSKYSGSALGDELSLEELLNMLADFLLHSGFGRQFAEPLEAQNPEQSLQDLYDAILEALLREGRLPQEWMEALEQGDQPADLQNLQDLLDSIIERMAREGYISLKDRGRPALLEPPRGGQGGSGSS